MQSPAFAGLTGTLSRGIRSATVHLLGDSTGDGSDEWFSLLGARLQQFYPNYGLVARNWSDPSQFYSPPTTLVPGPRGERRATFATGQSWWSAASITGDIEVVAKVAPSTWTSAQTVLAKYESTGNQRGWTFGLSASGRIQWIWSADGIATTTVTSTVSVPFTAGQAGWIKVAFDVDNGASGNTATFSTSTDGVTFTTLGTAATTAGVTSIFNNSTTSYMLGSFGAGFSQPVAGDIYWAEVRNGLAGYSIVPPLPENWDQVTTSATITYSGSPVILMMNGSVPATGVSYFDNATRRPKISPAVGQAVTFINTAHNETGFWQVYVTSVLSTAMTNLKTQVPGVPIVLIGQNPIVVGSVATTQQGADNRVDRQAQTLTWAASQAGLYPLDVYPNLAEFYDRSQGLSSDGLHPSRGPGSGSAAWADAVFAAIVGA